MQTNESAGEAYTAASIDILHRIQELTWAATDHINRNSGADRRPGSARELEYADRQLVKLIAYLERCK